LNLRTIGLRFRGKGQAINLYLDGFRIGRNHFADPSRFDYGLYLVGDDYYRSPIGELDMAKGTIEFWLTTDYNFEGRDYYNRFKHRSLFHISNTANDVLGAVVSRDGLGIYYGSMSDELSIYYTSLSYLERDSLFHIAVVFSNDGTAIGSDKSTIRLYISGELVSKTTDTWEVRDSKHFNFMLGGKNLYFVKMGDSVYDSSSVDGVVSNLKIYNYCKTDFDDSLNNYEEIGEKSIVKPSNFIEISRDNVTFYKVGDTNLPLIFSSVVNNQVVPIYVRTSIPDGLTGREARKSAIVASWDVTV
jgi:hypothetical protein